MREKSSLRCRSSCSSMFVCYNSPQNSILASAVRTKLATPLLFRTYPPLQFTLFAISAFKCFQVLSKNVAARPKNPRATQWDTFAFPSVRTINKDNLQLQLLWEPISQLSSSTCASHGGHRSRRYAHKDPHLWTNLGHSAPGNVKQLLELFGQ